MARIYTTRDEVSGLVRAGPASATLHCHRAACGL